jgi:DNA-binding transcriptional LysR family regulator
MQAFGQAHPDTELTLVVGNNEEVVGRVLSHEDDVAVSGRPPASERLIAQPFLQTEIVCITSADDPAAAAGPVTAASLTDRSWLLRERGSGTRAMNERFLSDRGLAPRTLTLGSNGAIKQAVRARLGVSLISRAAVETELRNGMLAEIRLTDGPEARPWFVVHSAVGPTRPLVQQFSDFARAAADAASALAGVEKLS